MEIIKDKQNNILKEVDRIVVDLASQANCEDDLSFTNKCRESLLKVYCKGQWDSAKSNQQINMSI